MRGRTGLFLSAGIAVAGVLGWSAASPSYPQTPQGQVSPTRSAPEAAAPPSAGNVPAPSSAATSNARAIGSATSGDRSTPRSSQEIPLKRFEPLAAYPFTTQAAVRGVLWGAEWLHRRHQTHGRFLYGFNPALREPLEGDDDLAQARAAMALAQAARFCGEEKYTVAAGQTILTLLAAAPVDAKDAQLRIPRAPSDVCNRVGFAASVILAIHALPSVEGRLLDEAERLALFLRRQARPDGSIHYIDDPAGDPLRQDPHGEYEHPGWALWAVASSHRHRPSSEKQELIRRGLRHYRARFRANPHPLLAASLILAASEWFAQTREAEAATAACEAADWLCTLQIPVTDPRLPQWAGGFRQFRDGRLVEAPSGPETGLLVLALSAACQVTRQIPDRDRFVRYATAVVDATRYLTGLQYTEANTRHFDNAFRMHMLIGAFHLSPRDGNIRLDATSHALLGLLRFLDSGAER
ncbi:MAG: hypothetical protein KatS3mg106_028 [Gemmataceae bacterium]|jgi:hypothetical protein|nr:MAG: hypothetical protein KatS3mg106_028 [Gemmataceae bacterium]